MGDSPNPIAALADAVRALVAAHDNGAPEGLDFDAAARFLGISRTAIYDLDRRALCPEPVTIGDSKRILIRSELRAWLICGCPSRKHWRAMRDAAIRRAG